VEDVEHPLDAVIFAEDERVVEDDRRGPAVPREKPRKGEPVQDGDLLARAAGQVVETILYGRPVIRLGRSVESSNSMRASP
jgi:hypothetical protein